MIFNTGYSEINNGTIAEYRKQGFYGNFTFGGNDIVRYDKEYSERL